MSNLNRRQVFTSTSYSSCGGYQQQTYTVYSSGTSVSGFQQRTFNTVQSGDTTADLATELASLNINDFQQECLAAHNEYRRKHGSPDVKINQSMCKYAQEWANKLLKMNKMEHRTNNKYGENLYMAYNMTVDGRKPVKSWYDEIKDYSFAKGQFSPKTGHFTQVVWRNCEEIGIGVATAKGRTFVVCNYDPPGNVLGQFTEQVRPEGSAPLPSTVNTVRSTTSAVSRSSNQFTPFEIACLEAHNAYRRKHGCPPLKLNQSLCKFSQEWAVILAKRGRMEHRTGSQYGENIYARSGAGEVTDGALPVKSWYDEIKDYTFGSGFSSSTGHFTQVIWKGTTELGVGIATKNNVCYIVCNYNPPGNYQGEFPKNVPRPVH